MLHKTDRVVSPCFLYEHGPLEQQGREKPRKSLSQRACFTGLMKRSRIITNSSTG